MDNENQVSLDWLFMRTWEELDEKTRRWRSLTGYEKIQLALPLRKLFLEETSLIRSVLKPRKSTVRKIKFSAHLFNVNWSEDVPSDWAEMAASADASGPILHGGAVIPGNDRTALVSLSDERWLAHHAGDGGNVVITVKDVIKYNAHVIGGVHFRGPETEVERVLHELDDLYRAPNLPQGMVEFGPAGALIGIATVSVNGLRPLYEAVKKEKDNASRPEA
jgi:hypothetical protein